LNGLLFSGPGTRKLAPELQALCTAVAAAMDGGVS
jgi:hypothetical protein